MKTEVIKLELAKKLQPFLKDRETEYMINNNQGEILSTSEYEAKIDYGIPMMWWYKTLTTIEAIEFLPNRICISNNGIGYFLEIYKRELTGYDICYVNDTRKIISPIEAGGETLHEAVESMLEHLLNKGLLQK